MKYALLSALLVAGCTNDDQSLTIARYVVMSGTGGSCLADPAVTTSVSSGLLDVKLSGLFNVGYLLAPVVRNGLLSIMNATTPEQNNVYISSFDIELKQSPGDVYLNGLTPADLKFNLPAAGGLIMPGGGQVSPILEVLPAMYVSALQNVSLTPSIHAIIVHMRANGAHSGVTLSSSWSDFPLYLCDGCLLNNGLDVFACPTGGIPAAQINKGACSFPQDANVTCCSDATGLLLCGPQIPVKAGM
jgi:hypothetical protein